MSVIAEKTGEHPSGLILFDEGYNSRCFTDGKRVIKVIPAGTTEEAAQRKLDQLAHEYGVIKTHLGEYAVDSSFSLGKDDGWVVKIEQEFTSGTPLRKSLGRPNPAINDFLRKSLEMYRETGRTPDLLPDIMFDPTLSVYFTGRFTFKSKPNVLLTPDEPRLIDTTFNRSLRSNLTGPILSSLVARRIQSILGGH